MASGFKNPPSFGDGQNSYESWRNELKMWELVTDLKAEKQAFAVILSLKGQAKAIALELDKIKLNAANGIEYLLEQLDPVFKKNETDISYSIYTNFDSLERKIDQNIGDYIIDFERLYNLCKNKDMALPEAVLAFKLLDKARLDPKEKQLALTACPTIKFENMKSALQRIFGENKCDSDSLDYGASVKQEVYFNKYQNSFRQKRGAFLGRSQDRIQKGTNPLDRQGRRTKCAVCSSVFHWVKDCPHKDVKYVSEENDECHLVMFTETKKHNLIFMTESFGSAILDTACTRTVCGAKWMFDYVESLSDEEKSQITEEKSERIFRFGDGSNVKAFKNVTIPAVIGTKRCKISADVVDLELPLLLSKESLKKANAVLDLNNDEATLFGQTVRLEQTSSGHYCVNLRSHFDNLQEVNQVLMVLSEMDYKEKVSAVIKLHRQFGHASQQKLRDLLKKANVQDREVYEILDKVVSECKLCIQFQKTPSRPAVSLPMASDFNELIAIDLHQLDKSVWYLHIIDIFTRFSAGAIVKTKDARVVGDQIVKHWISVFGPPKKIFTDNGGEFANEHMIQLGQQFNIEVITTAAFAPWSNGVCERHNMTLTEIINKVKLDYKCDYEVALAWALMSKNMLSNVYGYSSYQLVFGKNPNLPSILTDKLPALNEKSMSQMVGDHISALHATRKAFTETECSERIRRALRKQVRTNMDEIYRNGDKVFYKRPNEDEWRGPARVIGQDGVIVFLRHASQLVRVHVCRLKKIQGEKVGKDITNDYKSDYHEKSDTSVKPISESQDKAQIPVEEESKFDFSDLSDDEQVIQENYTQPQNHLSDESTSSSSEIVTLKPGQNIIFQESDEDIVKTAVVIGRAGKSTGKYKSWFNFNVRLESGEYEEKAVDISNLSKLEVIETLPQEETCIVMGDEFLEARELELKSWSDNNVFIEVKDEGQDCISTRWVYAWKDKDGSKIAKARLVIRGFEEEDKDIEKASPTCSSEGLKMVLTIMAQNEWSPKTMDIKTAFLQGNKLEREVFIKPPIEKRKNGIIWKLEKCVYGLVDASLYWYKRVKSFIEKSGGIVSCMDPAIFYWMNNNKIEGILACHVDDFLYGGSEQFCSEKGSDIRNEFTVGKEEEGSFKYVGMNIQQSDKVILLDQNSYAQSLKIIEISKERSIQKQCPITNSERKIMKAKIGQLLWLGRQTRPDLIFDASDLSTRVNNATVQDLIYTNKIMKKAMTENVTLKFRKLDCPEMKIYSDASLGNCQTGNTQGGYFIFLQSGKNINPLSWSSKKLKRIARSTLAAETLAMADAMDNGIFSASLLSELTTGTVKPEILNISLVTDCRSLHDNLNSNKAVTEKRLRLEIAAIREALQRELIKESVWVSTENQIADVLTKRGVSPLRLLAALEKGKLL